MALTLSELQQCVERLIAEKGFRELLEDPWRLAALMHTEVSEYTQLTKRYGLDEAHRKERASEVADMVIRAMAFAILEETLTEHEN